VWGGFKEKFWGVGVFWPPPPPPLPASSQAFSLVKRGVKEREPGIKVVVEKAFNENWFNKAYNSSKPHQRPTTDLLKLAMQLQSNFFNLIVRFLNKWKAW